MNKIREGSYWVIKNVRWGRPDDAIRIDSLSTEFLEPIACVTYIRAGRTTNLYFSTILTFFEPLDRLRAAVLFGIAIE